MRIFELRRGAGSRFQMMRFVHEDDGDFKKWEHLASDASIAGRWAPPRLRFYEPGETGIPGDSRKRPRSTATDMPYVYGHGLLVVSARLVAQCGHLLRLYGEFLPVECEGGEFFAYHCTNVVDCLDEARSRLSRSRADGRILNVYEPAFVLDRLHEGVVFRLPVGNRQLVFCAESVVNALTSPPLQGVTASLVWEPT